MSDNVQVGGDAARDIESKLKELESMGIDDDVLVPGDYGFVRMPWKGCAAYVMPCGEIMLSKGAARLFGESDIEEMTVRKVKVLVNGRTFDAHTMWATAAASPGFDGWRSVIADWIRHRILYRHVPFKNCDTAVGGDILVGTLARLLYQGGVRNIGQNRLFAWLRDMGYLCRRRGEQHNMPTQESVERGLFRISFGVREKSDGTIVSTRTVRVTPKGVGHFLKMPVCAFETAGAL